MCVSSLPPVIACMLNYDNIGKLSPANKLKADWHEIVSIEVAPKAASYCIELRGAQSARQSIANCENAFEDVTFQ